MKQFFGTWELGNSTPTTYLSIHRTVMYALASYEATKLRNRRGFWSRIEGVRQRSKTDLIITVRSPLRRVAPPLRLIFNLPISEVVRRDAQVHTWEVVERESRSRHLIGVTTKVEESHNYVKTWRLHDSQLLAPSLPHSSL